MEGLTNLGAVPGWVVGWGRGVGIRMIFNVLDARAMLRIPVSIL